MRCSGEVYLRLTLGGGKILRLRLRMTKRKGAQNDRKRRAGIIRRE